MDQDTFSNMTVGNIVKESYQTAEIFKKYNIDFCCNGKVTIYEVCSKNNIIIDELLKELNEAKSKPTSETWKIFKDWEPDFLAEYIVNVHHKYVKLTNPMLLEYTHKIANVHGDRHPELIQISRLFTDLVAELTQHMHKEEVVLFPYITNIYTAYKNNAPITPSHFETVRNPIGMMEKEHENVGTILKKMRGLSNNYELPDDSCNTYMITYKKLDEYENDLHQHIHLENNILFPKAIELEEKLWQ